jgi:pectate lyase
MGWAAVADLGLDGTTGGEGGEVVDVATTADFVAANERTEPLVIRVSGTIGDGLRLAVGSNKTILGVGERPTVQGSIEIEGVQNVIVRNLYVMATTAPTVATARARAAPTRCKSAKALTTSGSTTWTLPTAPTETST